MPILVIVGLSVLDLGPMYATDVRRQTASPLNAPLGGGIRSSIASKPTNAARIGEYAATVEPR